MRALFTSTAGAGHVGPLLPLADALIRRGDDVEFVVPPGAEWQVEGRRFLVTTGAGPPAEEMEVLWARFAQATRSEARRIAEREAFAQRCTAAMLPSVSAAVGRARPDVVLREPCEYAAAVAAVRAEVPVATVAISLAAAEWGVLDFVADVVDRHGPGTPAVLAAAPFLTRFPPALDPSPFPCTVRYRDRPAQEPAAGGQTSADPWPPGHAGRRLYVTLGSRAGATPRGAAGFRTLLQAVSGLDARILVAVGRDVDVAALGPVPANVAVRAWVDQDQVLAGCDAVICHGGSGTTYGALAYGVPVGFLPMFADQPVNARAVVGTGAGLLPHEFAGDGGNPAVIREIGPALVPQIRAMAEALLGDARYRAAARRVAEEMAVLPDVDTVAGMVAGWAGGEPMQGCGDG